MTGGVEKRFQSVKFLIHMPNYSIFEILNPNYYTLSTIKTKLQSTFIPNHSFSVLGLYNCNNTKNYDSCLFQLYNPWGSDPAVSKFVEQFMQNKNIPQFSKQAILQDKNDDGIFFLPFSVILMHFDKIISVAALHGYKTIYERYGIKQDIKTDYSIQYKINGTGPLIIYFEILMQEVLRKQIKPYKLVKVSCIHGKSILTKQNEGESGLVYQGIYIENSEKYDVISVNITLEKFNYDIIDKILLRYYSNGSVQRISPVNIKNECVLNCNGHGICINNTFCMCEANV